MLIGFVPLATAYTPSAVSSVSFGRYASNLFVGSDDGTLRLYNIASSEPVRVVKAVRGLGAEVSSIVIPVDDSKATNARPDWKERELWVAAGRKAFLFDISVEDMILTPAAAKQTIELGDNDEDVVNELSVNSSASLLAFTTDNGHVGVVDLVTMKVSKMKTKHDSICGSVKFIPHRPSELVSGGYDSSLLHFDHVQRALLSRHTFGAPPPTLGLGAGLALSPPFVLCTAISSTGVLAAGTADGRLWIGMGGEKAPASTGSRGGGGGKKKKARKWEGLRAEAAFEERIAEGPVVGVAFLSPDMLFTSTLLGTLSCFEMVLPTDTSGGQKLALKKRWTGESPNIAKANALVANATIVVTSGFGRDGKGVAEVWGMGESLDPRVSKDAILYYKP